MKLFKKKYERFKLFQEMDHDVPSREYSDAESNLDQDKHESSSDNDSGDNDHDHGSGPGSGPGPGNSGHAGYDHASKGDQSSCVA